MDLTELRRRVAEFHRAYLEDPDFVDQQYGLPCVADVLSRPDVIGVVRFTEFLSFAPERLFSLVYRSSLIEISAAVGEESLLGSVPVIFEPNEAGEIEIEEGVPFNSAGVWRGTATLALPSEMFPVVLQSWESLRVATLCAGDCCTPMNDGVWYRHRVADRNSQSVASWLNPNSQEHVPQTALIDSYTALLRHLDLDQR